MRREARFDEAEREAWIAKWEFDQETCPQCGNQRSVCSDPNIDNYPRESVCWVTAAREVHQRRWENKHGDAKPDKAGYLPGDGLTLWVSQQDPEGTESQSEPEEVSRG